MRTRIVAKIVSGVLSIGALAVAWGFLMTMIAPRPWSIVFSLLGGVVIGNLGVVLLTLWIDE